MALAVLAWPFSAGALHVANGLGPSWQTTLATAANNGMPFGTRIIFTYGPLGFLVDQQLDFSWTAVLSFLFTLALFTAVFGTLVWGLRRVTPLIVAVAVSYAVGFYPPKVLGTVVEFGLALVLVACVAMLSRSDEDPAPRWIWMGLGAGFVVFSLVKVSLGVTIAAALIVTIACLPRGRSRAMGCLAIGVVPTFCLSWFATGNGVGNMIAFAKSSAAIIGGYAPAMSVEESSRFYAYALAGVVLLIIGAFAVAHGRGLPRRSNIGIGLITTVTLWALLKEGFVRHDTHDLIFFAAAPIVLVAFAPKRRPWVLVPGVLVLTGILFLAAIGTGSLVPQPAVSVGNFFDQATVLASPDRTATVIDQSRQSLRETYALPGNMVTMMLGHTVDVSPWEQNVAWAYPKIRFDPLPVIQDYSAYTPSLDQIDANYLASSDAPRFILRQPGLALDGRNPAFEPPATQLAVECRYRQVAGNASWQLLEQGADRCGPLQSLGTVTTGFNHWVTVPTAPAGDAIVARFQLSLGLLYKLESAVFKPDSVYMQYNGSRKNSWRFVTGTATDLHLLRAPSTLGYDSGPAPVSLTSFRFAIAGGHSTPAGVTVQFYGVHIASVVGGKKAKLPPLVTRVLRPANGTKVSGSVPLDASATESLMATDKLHRTKVEFYLSGPSQNDTLVGTGTLTLVGWFALWNSATVPNGTYTLHSVAYDSSGRSTQSNRITITVSN